jgi:carboxylesterase
MNGPTVESAFFNEPEHQPFEIGEGPSGVLLIHGFVGTPAEMRPLGERLAAAGYYTRGILLPGFGPDIPRLQETHRHEWISAAASAWEQVRAKGDTSILIGFSMGGAIAMHLAATNPPDLLILLAPFWKMGGWQYRLLPLLKYVVPSVAPFEKANFDDPGVRDQLAAIAPGADLTDPETQRVFREDVRLPLRILDEVRRLGLEAGRLAPRIATPTLILHGEQDLTVSPITTRQLATRFSGPVTYREVPGDHGFIRFTADRHHDIAADVLTFMDKKGRKEISR